MKVIPVVASTALARRMERCGADAVVAEGCEAGGHIGENTTMVLVPQIVDAVKIPVIAAGGIADGRGMAAAFMLGAKAVQLGTVFVTTEESQVHENYKSHYQGKRYRFPCNRKNCRTSCQSIEKSDDEEVSGTGKIRSRI